MPRKQRKLLGRYIVSDPAICHGKATFIGTRIMVWQVLEMVAEGMPWDKISTEWRSDVSKEAIAEAVELREQVETLEHAPGSAASTYRTEDGEGQPPPRGLDGMERREGRT
jgi:uncharacterized protein (DUF433 family)